MSYQIGYTKLCERGCKLFIVWKGKDFDRPGSTGWYDKDNQNIAHTYRHCDNIIKKIREAERKTQEFIGLEYFGLES